jgi:hypothetical protein
MLRLTRYRFTLCMEDPVRLPSYAGSALRGVFGHGLRQSVCVTRLRDCNKCALCAQCVYSYLFETPLYAGKGSNAPQPLVPDLHGLGSRYAPGECFSFEITVIGEAVRHLSYVIQAWRRAGKQGLGPNRAKFSLSRVEILDLQAQGWRQLIPEAGSDAVCEPWQDPLSANKTVPRQLRIDLTTPYRGKRDGHLVTPEQFSAQGFAVALVNRVASLQQFHDRGGQPFDSLALIHAAANLTLSQARLRWREWQRHSSRQRTHMQMGGVTGSFTLGGEGLADLWPILQLGQWVHAGKSTLFGLGRYRIHPAEERT